MATPPLNDPEYAPLRHPRWPSQRMPRWLWLAGAVVLAGAVLVGWAVHPSRSQRAADMNGFLTDVTTYIQSCAGGVRESLFALHEIQSGAETDVATAIKIAKDGANNCSPANSTPLADLTQYQVHESLASFHLDRAVNDLVTWAFPDAMYVQSDVAAVLSAKTPASKAAATAKLNTDLAVLDAQRSKVYEVMRHAAIATSATVRLPVLPG